MWKPSQVMIALLGGAATTFFAWYSWTAWDQEARLRNAKQAAQAQVDRWAELLEAQAATPGGERRRLPAELPEKDPWGRPLQVQHTRNGIAENLVVRSVGPDGIAHSSDDLTAQRGSLNLKATGQALLDQIEEAARLGNTGLMKHKWEGLKYHFSSFLRQ